MLGCQLEPKVVHSLSVVDRSNGRGNGECEGNWAFGRAWYRGNEEDSRRSWRVEGCKNVRGVKCWLGKKGTHQERP